MKVLKDTPLTEITLRRYEKPYNLSKRELVKKLCLSLGMLQPGDSRDIVVDVLYTMLQNKKEMSSEQIVAEVIALRKEHKLQMVGIASSNIRRQIKRLRDLLLLEKVKNNYRLTENQKLSEIFNEKIHDIALNSIVSRVREYAQLVDEEFK
jgi:hypothetical protein